MGRQNNQSVVKQSNGGSALEPKPMEGGDSPSRANNTEARWWNGLEFPLRAERSHPGHRWGVSLQHRRGMHTTHLTLITSHRRPQIRRPMRGREYKKEWWDVKRKMWSRPEGGKGQGRGAFQPVWMPAQNADSGWGPTNPRMQVGKGSQRVSQTDKKGGCPEISGKREMEGRRKKGKGSWPVRQRRLQTSPQRLRAQGLAQDEPPAPAPPSRT